MRNIVNATSVTNIRDIVLILHVVPIVEVAHVVDNVNVAKPGFINFYIKPITKLDYLCAAVAEVYYGWEGIKKNEKLIVEYVSANPTGPLHVGHARQAVLGDAISKILSKVGCEVFQKRD